ncbi:MAG: tRNA lysidine(34) synthetase TilS [Bacteroidota bacterium]|nr:tRNA lysidine(34) synthetase TilS [Bacteroidota bacterium]
MLKEFNAYIQQHELFEKTDKILLTVSGGIDSVVMCNLFHEAGIEFGIAHCNFGLRGNESEEDETFVEELAESMGVPFHTITFNTSAYAKKNKTSIQTAARTLRYEWFEEIRKNFNYKFIATAHHSDDSIETFFLNLLRGTGIGGLHGIRQKNGRIIRPLLFSSKESIIGYAKKNKIAFRNDSSNDSDNYSRNKIRHKVLPLLKEFNPSLEHSILKSIQQIADAEIIYLQEIERARKSFCKKHQDGFRISIKKLKSLHPVETYLFEFLRPFGFNSTDAANILSSLENISGKQFLSASHRLIKDREYLLIEKIIFDEVQPLEKTGIKSGQKEVSLNDFSLQFKSIKKLKNQELFQDENNACIDKDKLEFPLHLRKWEKGDYFYPLGMKGKKKKLSDFFVDRKIPLPVKEKTWLLCSGDQIVWVVGQRLDERFKVTDSTTKIYFVSIH